MAKKAMKNFMEEIRSNLNVLQDFPGDENTLYENDDLRLDMQGMTNDGYHNLQIQPNSQSKIKKIKELEKDRISLAVVLSISKPNPELVYNALLDSYDTMLEENDHFVNGVCYIVDAEGSRRA